MIAKRPEPDIEYPCSDGKPMADNTLQFQWIVTIEGNLERLFRDDPNVLVAGDNLWYPVAGEDKIRQAPDVYVVFGRPKGHRSSYVQHLEGGIPLTVVFEVLSPGNTKKEMDEKLTFYDDYGVEEYYVYDPQKEKLTAFLRGREALRKVRVGKEFVSPRLKIRLDLTADVLRIFYPNGDRFDTFAEVMMAREDEKEGADAEKEAPTRPSSADAEKERADKAQQRAEQMAAKLRALGIDPEA